MTLTEQTQSLRQQLCAWANEPEWDLLIRYELLPQKPSPVLNQRISQKVGRLLRVLGVSRGRYLKQKWQAGLKHAHSDPEGKTLLIWDNEHNREAVREACLKIKGFLLEHPKLLPVLVTRVADFAFYSRLGWLVEYLPDLAGDGPPYLERKQRYLAWRYRDALALPLSAGLSSKEEFNALIRLR